MSPSFGGVKLVVIKRATFGWLSVESSISIFVPPTCTKCPSNELTEWSESGPLPRYKKRNPKILLDIRISNYLINQSILAHDLYFNLPLSNHSGIETLHCRVVPFSFENIPQGDDSDSKLFRL